MRAGLVQLTVTDDPAANLPATQALVRAAAAGGAGFVLYQLPVVEPRTSAVSVSSGARRSHPRHPAG